MSQTPSQPSSELLLLVGRMDGKLDLMLTQHAEHGKRLSALEAWRNKTLGISAVISAVIAAVASQVPALLPFLRH